MALLAAANLAGGERQEYRDALLKGDLMLLPFDGFKLVPGLPGTTVDHILIIATESPHDDVKLLAVHTLTLMCQ